jgi:SAM-dependent methyltransferase
MPQPAPLPCAPEDDSLSSAFTRTCAVTDFVGCQSVADWQQQIAIAAYARWHAIQPLAPRAPALVVNWSGCVFRGPGRVIDTADAYPIDLPVLSAVFGLSVLDRIDAPQHFLRQAAARLIPGGLIVCTYAYWDASGPDVAVGHEVRRRIYDRRAIERLIDDLRRVGLTVFGRIDWRYRGDALGDHTLASLALVTEKGSDR